MLLLLLLQLVVGSVRSRSGGGGGRCGGHNAIFLLQLLLVRTVTVHCTTVWTPVSVLLGLRWTVLRTTW